VLGRVGKEGRRKLGGVWGCLCFWGGGDLVWRGGERGGLGGGWFGLGLGVRYYCVGGCLVVFGVGGWGGG